MRRILVLLAVLLATISVGAADKPFELGNIPSNFSISVTVDAEKLKKNLTDLGVPVAKAIAKAKDEQKLDVGHFARGTMILELNPAGPEAALPVFFVATKAATAKEDLGKILESETEATLAGKAVIKGKEKIANRPSYGATLGEKALVFGPESTVAKVLSAGGKGGDLTKEFEKADLNHDAIVLVAMKPLLAGLKETFPDLDKSVPPVFEQFWVATKRLEAISLTADLTDDTLLKGVFRADNVEGADLVKQSLAGGVALISLALPKLKEGIGRDLPPEAKKPVFAVVEAIAKTSKFKVEGSTVTMTVARPKDFGK